MMHLGTFPRGCYSVIVPLCNKHKHKATYAISLYVVRFLFLFQAVCHCLNEHNYWSKSTSKSAINGEIFFIVLLTNENKA